MQQFTLSNGIPVVCDVIPHLRSVSVGIGVRAGSMLESPQENGLSHYMEHMAFKGTEKRTSREIAQALDSVGGYLNAATSKLNTVYYARVIDEDLPLAVDVLCDLVTSPRMDARDFEKERSVILEEIAMVEDCPEDLIFDVLSEAVFPGQALGQAVLGPRERIEHVTVQDLISFREKHYGPANTVISVAGNFDPAQLTDLLEKHIGSWQGGSGCPFPAQTVNPKQTVLCRAKNIEQVHLALSYTGVPLGDPRAYDLAILNNIIGSSDSSRLFQRIREELGLVYSVYSAPSAYPGCGEFTLYAACSPQNTPKVIDALKKEMAELRANAPAEKEFLSARAQLRGSFLLSLESAYNRMNAMLADRMLLGRVVTVEETLRGISAVTPESLMALTEEVLSSAPSSAVIGRKAARFEQRLQGF